MKLGSVWAGYHRSPRPFLYLHTPWWHIVIGRWQDRLFSERYGYVWCRKVLGLRLTIRNLSAGKDTHS